jgi:hypothetical protein
VFFAGFKWVSPGYLGDPCGCPRHPSTAATAFPLGDEGSGVERGGTPAARRGQVKGALAARRSRGVATWRGRVWGPGSKAWLLPLAPTTRWPWTSASGPWGKPWCRNQSRSAWRAVRGNARARRRRVEVPFTFNANWFYRDLLQKLELC